MKNNLTVAILAAVFILFAGSCSKSADISPVDKALSGDWNWVKTEGGFGDHIKDNPASTGKNMLLEFSAGRKYCIYINGIVSSEGNYTIETANCIHDHYDKSFINFSHDPDLMIEQFNDNSLVLSDETYDGLASTWSRK